MDDITIPDGTIWWWDGASFRVRNRDQRTLLLAYDLELTCVADGPYHKVGDVVIESTERLRKFGKIEQKATR